MQPPEENYGTVNSSAEESFTARSEQFAREEPMRAVRIAFIAGLILTFLPIGTIIAGLLRLAFALVRPVLLVLGAAKVYDEIQKRQ